MTDHDLLQAAATAAGYHFDPTRHDSRGLWIVRPGAEYQEDQILWNPFEHPDQAMELAADYRMSVVFGIGSAHTTCKGVEIRLQDDTTLSAACRAIVLTVVRIGKKP